ncbi:hypothetical protein LJR175_008402 [Variovorax sp. LjRoot175]|uniref:hypothetical protein n=1 Tax=Variovorax sp. LjRoot175 TaxID=3342276 RepID=UPI003ECFA912
MNQPKEIIKAPIRPIAIGQVWAQADPRIPTAPRIEVVEMSAPRKHLFARNKVAVVQDIGIKNMATGRVSHARSDRFNGKKDGYVFVREAPKL